MKKKYLEPEAEAIHLAFGASILTGSLDLNKQTVSWNWDEEDEEYN